jgi:hypothetical protein
MNQIENDEYMMMVIVNIDDNEDQYHLNLYKFYYL